MLLQGRLFLAKPVLVLLLVCASACCVWAQQAASARGDEARVRALEVLWNQAELKRDSRALEQLLADRFIYTDIDGTLQHRQEFLDSVRNPTDRITSIGNESMSTEAYEDTVIMYGVYVEKGTTNGKPYMHRGRFTDTWVKEGQEWRCVASHATLIQK
jgi:hypothetical protein